MKITGWFGATLGLALVALAAAADRPASTADLSLKSKAGADALARLIDDQIDAKLKGASITPSPQADDAEFLRRVSLDLTGVIPSVARASSFLESRDPLKRTKLVDELLDSPKFARHEAGTWESLLMIRDSSNRRLKSDPLLDWLTERFESNTPWNRTVADIVSATGTQEENGAATFTIALRTPDKLTDQVSSLFLGVQLQCAQCHNHPYASWKRDDYWALAGFFSKVRAGGKKVGVAKNGPEDVNEEGRGKKPPAVDSALDRSPKFLGGDKPKLAQSQPFRPALASWLARPDNPFVARAMVNRTWSQFFGRGLVDPVDNINDFASATHPELFEELTKRFVASNFDLKQLIRGICTSHVYQRASGDSKDATATDPGYARMVVRPMSPEQLYDSLELILGSPTDTTANTPKEARKAAAKAARKNGPNGPRTKFLAFFDTPDGADPGEYSTGIPQVLHLMNAPRMNKDAPFFDELFGSSRTPTQALDRLYLATLSRPPSKAERTRITTFLSKEKGDPREEFADLLWVLLNSSEFALNH